MTGIRKIRVFMEETIKVHVTLIPTSRFPNGKFYNGFFIEEKEGYFIFRDDVEGDVRIFLEDIDNVEEYKKEFKPSFFQP